MGQKTDFSKIDVPKVLEKFNIRNIRETRNEVMFSCPFPEHHRGDQNPSSSINIDTGKWHCFGCGRSGNIINFISQLENVSEVIASRWVREGFSLDYYLGSSLQEELSRILSNQKKAKKPKRTISEEYIGFFKINWTKAYTIWESGDLPNRLGYLFKRGFSASDLMDWEIGWDEFTNRFTFPVRDIKGKLIGFKGRASSNREEPRYISIGDKQTVRYGFPTIKINDHVYGLFSAEPPLIIVEGELDTIALRSKGFKGAVGLFGSNPSKKQSRLIKSVDDKVILMLDNDKAGKKAESILFRKLIKYVPTEIACLKDKDPAEMSKQEITKILGTTKKPLLR